VQLLIVSHTPHYRRDGELVGWGPTVREIDALGELFETVVHVAPVHPQPAPASALAYRCPRVRVRAVEPAGGVRWRDKLRIVARAPGWARVIAQELERADVAHLRCPANISLVALAVLAAGGRPERRWAKYAGAWRPAGSDAWSNRVQRWWLARRWRRGWVSINGSWPDQPPHVRSFLNPCLSEEELAEGRRAAQGKRLNRPLRLAFVGRLEQDKGLPAALEIVTRLRRRGVEAVLEVAGEGPARTPAEGVTYHGWLPRPQVGKIYARSQLLLLPSRSEGWPKVLSEGMAYGVVPVAGAVGSIPELLGRWRTGRALDPSDLDSFVGAVSWYCEYPEAWKEESERGVQAAEQFSYHRYVEAVRKSL
jgi:glycosyltransferase involved in cell wall biosynthesis